MDRNYVEAWAATIIAGALGGLVSFAMIFLAGACDVRVVPVPAYSCPCCEPCDCGPECCPPCPDCPDCPDSPDADEGAALEPAPLWDPKPVAEITR